jgi:hypothetical protein
MSGGPGPIWAPWARGPHGPTWASIGPWATRLNEGPHGPMGHIKPKTCHSYHMLKTCSAIMMYNVEHNMGNMFHVYLQNMVVTQLYNGRPTHTHTHTHTHTPKTNYGKPTEQVHHPWAHFGPNSDGEPMGPWATWAHMGPYGPVWAVSHSWMLVFQFV